MKNLSRLQTAAEIVHNVMKKLIELSVEGAKVIDLCVEGDKLLEQGTGAVYNKSVKGAKVPKGTSQKLHRLASLRFYPSRCCFPNLCVD